MDSAAKSDGGCREDKDGTDGTGRNVENTDDPTDEVPIFLRTDFHDVFPSLASMLDIKSFIKLAMASKEMYKRCTEDKSIKISVSSVSVRNSAYSLPELHFPYARPDSFLVALRKLRCKITINKLDLRKMDDCSFIRTTGQYLKEIGVATVHSLDVTYYRSQKCPHHYSGVCESLLTFIRDFKVKDLCVWDSNDNLPLPYIQTILQQNLKSALFNTYRTPVSFEFLMEISSKIPQVTFAETKELSKDEFMELLSKIQSGSFNRLSISPLSVDWDIFDKLPFDHEGLLPDDRPLLFARRREDFDEYWFLHGNGCYTKCIDNCRTALNRDTLTLSKCEPCDSPFVSPKDEDILKKLAEGHPTVCCNASHFRSFAAGLTMIDSSHEGSLPEERPLYFKVSENHFWMLDKYDKLMSCTWDSGCALWDSLNLYQPLGHPVLTKYMFWKLIKGKHRFYERIHCESSGVFNSWFEGFQLIKKDAPLPDERPVVHQNTPDDRVILFKNHCVRCKLNDDTVDIKDCPIPDRPWILNAAEFAKILQSSLKGDVSVGNCKLKFGVEERKFSTKDSDLRVGLQVFRDGFDLFKTLPLDYFHPQRHVLVYSKTEMNSDGEITEERFYASPSDFMKATWEKGKFTLSPGNLCETSLEFAKQCFKLSAQKQNSIRHSLELDQFRSCLEQFPSVSFSYFGSLLNGDSPLVFMKKEIRHIYWEPSKINAWILWENKLATYCTWEAKEVPELRFEMPSAPEDIPFALKSTVYLKILLQCKYEKEMVYRWFGSFEDFCFRLNDYKMMPPNYNGPLTYDCPLAFYYDSDWPKTSQARARFASSPPSSFCFLLRQDGTVIKCSYEGSHIALFLPSPSDYLIPPALKSLLL